MRREIREISFFALSRYPKRINQVRSHGKKRVVKDKLHEKGLKASSRGDLVWRSFLAGSPVLNSFG